MYLCYVILWSYFWDVYNLHNIIILVHHPSQIVAPAHKFKYFISANLHDSVFNCVAISFSSFPCQNHRSHLDQHPRKSEQLSGYLNLQAQIELFHGNCEVQYWPFEVLLLLCICWTCMSGFWFTWSFALKCSAYFDVHCQCIIQFKDRAI